MELYAKRDIEKRRSIADIEWHETWMFVAFYVFFFYINSILCRLFKFKVADLKRKLREIWEFWNVKFQERKLRKPYPAIRA